MPLGTLGKYERLDVLGHGATGIVYLAKDTLLNRQIALKEVDIHAADLPRFLEEARVMDRLRHPHIVRVHSIDRIADKIVIDMEYVRGRNLQSILREEGSLDPERAVNIAVQTLDALDYAHQMQTVHRDIKPANILITVQGEVKLVDFGLAEILSTNAYAGGAGTYAYMAPEDFAEEDRSDHQSDIWAVGVTLFEMLTGQRPFLVNKVMDPFSWKRTLENDLPRPLVSYLSGPFPEMQEILNRALAREKRRRYQSAGEFRNDLLRLRAGKLKNAARFDLGRAAVTLMHPKPDPSSSVGLKNGMLSAHQNSAGGLLVDATIASVSKFPPQAAGTKLNSAVVPLVTVRPARVDFGSVRQGRQTTRRVKVTVEGVEGPIIGNIVKFPDWMSVLPPAFAHARQSITLTAHAAPSAALQGCNDTVRIETNAGVVELTVTMTVIRARPTFFDIAGWFVPLYIITLLPALTIAFANDLQHPMRANIATLLPSGAIASGLLAIMLLLIGAVINIGILERLACGIIVLAASSTLGISLERWNPDVSIAGFKGALPVACMLGAILLVQLLNRRHWKVWAFTVALLGLFVSGILLKDILGFNLLAMNVPSNSLHIIQMSDWRYT